MCTHHFHSFNRMPLNHSSQQPDIVVLPTVISPPSSQVHFSLCFPWTLNWDVLLYVHVEPGQAPHLKPEKEIPAVSLAS